MLRLTVLLVAAVLALAAPAQAQDDARTLFQRGQVAYTQGDYDAAIAQWSQAYSMDPRPLLQWNLAQAYERLGRLEEAASALDSYLAHADPSDEHQADARARLGAIRQRIESTGVLLQGGPEGGTILLDGQDAGRLPRPDAIHVTPGSHHIVVRAPGYADFTSTVVVPAGQRTEIAVEMASSASSTPVASGSSGPPIGPIVLFAGAGVTLIAGAALGGVALSSAGTALPGTPDADTAHTLAIASDVLFGTSLACAAVGLILVLVDGGSSSSETQHAGLRLRADGFALTF